MTAAADIRLRLRSAGFAPLPLAGKIPMPKGWSKLTDASEKEIESWAGIYPGAENTGILTKFTPALDIDIIDPDAAKAIEDLARERFEEKGPVLVRFGRPPKRAILFRTDAPFAKIRRLFGEPDTPERDCEKLELMCDGQQLAARHPPARPRRP
jgi:Bifunctional DNA primase/polymerase, N-terminal